MATCLADGEDGFQTALPRFGAWLFLGTAEASVFICDFEYRVYTSFCSKCSLLFAPALDGHPFLEFFCGGDLGRAHEHDE